MTKIYMINIDMFHQHAAKVLEDCEQANMVVVFALNDYVFQDDIQHQTSLLSDLLLKISFAGFN